MSNEMDDEVTQDLGDYLMQRLDTDEQKAQFRDLLTHLQISDFTLMLQRPPDVLNLDDEVLRSLVEYFRMMTVATSRHLGGEERALPLGIVAGLVYGHQLATRQIGPGVGTFPSSPQP